MVPLRSHRISRNDLQFILAQDSSRSHILVCRDVYSYSPSIAFIFSCRDKVVRMAELTINALSGHPSALCTVSEIKNEVSVDAGKQYASDT